MAKEKKTNYGSDEIQVLKGLEAVRKRPGMYIGSTDSRGLHHLVWEILDNAMDEVLSDFCDTVKLTIKKGNIVQVEDNGRGIPIGMHKEGVPTPQVVFCMLHAGGKFDASSYKVAGGLHGVGSSVVNALSSWLNVTIYRDGKCYKQTFSNGGTVIGKPKITSDSSKKHGSIVEFKPDPTMFSTTIIDYKQCVQRLKEAAFLIKGLTVELTDERTGAHDKFQYNEGIVEYIKDLNTGKEAFHEPIFISGISNEITIEAAIQYTNNPRQENIISFVNNIRTRDGGTHESGFKSAITKAFNEYSRNRKLLKEKDPNLEGIDVRDGINAIISVRVPEKLLQFEGQTKNKLGTAEAKVAVEQLIVEKLKFFLFENTNVADLLANNALRSFKSREEAKKKKDENKEIKAKISKPVNMNGKLVPVQVKNPNTNELFIVEGDSAGGSAKLGRDPLYQAILPLRGKTLNTERIKVDELLKNEELCSLIHTIGTGIGSDFNISKCNYKKIIIMTDADDDGAHIQILLLTFFFRHMRKLIEEGKIYIALPPLYKVSNKTTTHYVWTNEELKELIADMKNYEIQRFKGLGEMNYNQLWETTMNPETRTLIRVNIDDLSDAENRISVLMGDDVEPRRNWIESNVSFDAEDDFDLDFGEGDTDE